MGNTATRRGSKADSFSSGELGKSHRKAVSTLGIMSENQQIVVGGHDILEEILPREGFSQVLHLFFKKRLPDPKAARVLELLAIALNYPDIRIWPIGAVALAGAAGATVASALSAGILGIESRIFGVIAVEEAAKGFREAEKNKRNGRLESHLEGLIEARKIIYGFGRPVFRTDERVPPVLREARKLGLESRKWIDLALEMEEILGRKKGLRLNYGGVIAALLLDIGFSEVEIGAFFVYAVVVNFLGVFLEQHRTAKPIFPISCLDIEYLGPEPRTGGAR